MRNYDVRAKARRKITLINPSFKAGVITQDIGGGFSPNNFYNLKQ